jgi:uncharacterized protein YjgD (DUF1641 family)
MKTIPVMILFLTTIILSAQQSAVDYLNTVNQQKNEVVFTTMDYVVATVHSEDPNAVDRKRIEVIRRIDMSINNLRSIESFEGNNKLKKEAVRVLELYKQAFTTEFNEANLLKQKKEESYEAMEDYFEAQAKAEEKLEKAGDEFEEVVMDFAADYKIEINWDTKMLDELESINQANHYIRTVFLEYFRVSKMNAAYSDALLEKKVKEMKENRSEMFVEAGKALSKVRSVGKFRDESGYYDAAIALLEYFKNLASDDYVELISIVEKEKNNTLTQEDVERFNKLVTGVNDTLPGLIEELNKQNNELLKTVVPDGKPKERV